MTDPCWPTLAPTPDLGGVLQGPSAGVSSWLHFWHFARTFGACARSSSSTPCRRCANGKASPRDSPPRLTIFPSPATHRQLRELLLRIATMAEARTPFVVSVDEVEGFVSPREAAKSSARLLSPARLAHARGQLVRRRPPQGGLGMRPTGRSRRPMCFISGKSARGGGRRLRWHPERWTSSAFGTSDPSCRPRHESGRRSARGVPGHRLAAVPTRSRGGSARSSPTFGRGSHRTRLRPSRRRRRPDPLMIT